MVQIRFSSVLCFVGSVLMPWWVASDLQSTDDVNKIKTGTQQPARVRVQTVILTELQNHLVRFLKSPQPFLERALKSCQSCGNIKCDNTWMKYVEMLPSAAQTWWNVRSVGEWSGMNIVVQFVSLVMDGSFLWWWGDLEFMCVDEKFWVSCLYLCGKIFSGALHLVKQILGSMAG